MKMNILLLILLVTIMIAGCKKDNVAERSSDRLQGQWQMMKRIDVDYRNDQETDRDTTTETDSGIFEFKNDSLLVYRDGALGDRYRYTLEGNQLILRQGSEGIFLELKWLHNDEISLLLDDTWVSSKGEKRRSTQEMFFNRLPAN